MPIVHNVIADAYGFLPLQAYGELKNSDWRFAAGLMFDVFNPGIPTVLPFSALAASGNSGNAFRGQLRVERYFNPSDKVQWTIQAALSEPITTTVDPAFRLSEDDGWPNVEGRIALGLGPVEMVGLAAKRPLELGISGVIGQLRTTPLPPGSPSDRVVADVWGLGTDFRWKITERFGVMGEFYTGETLGTYNGGILQNINAVTLQGIRATGGWMGLFTYWTPCLHSHIGYGIDKAKDADVASVVSAAGRTRNSTTFGNLLWDVRMVHRSLRTKPLVVGLLTGLVCSVASTAAAKTLEVGPGKAFSRIEEANAEANPGDLILVYPLPGDRPYTKTAVYVRQRDITFRAVPSQDARWVKISGKGFDYRGQGSTPRAIFQFNRATDRCVLEGFELLDAHNESHNGAGVRINQANDVTIRNCNIHHNDMGIMSGGDNTSGTAINQQIQDCIIHHNGDLDDPGYNHNLYLGGTSVTLSGCEVHSSLTGHNVKSRAHHTSVQYCYVHHSASREFDLVDSADTERPESHAVLMGNIIVKDPNCSGNRTLLHFGQDGGRKHIGTVYLFYNTIVTPFISPVVSLSSPEAKAHLLGNLVCDGGVKQNNQQIAAVRAGAKMRNITGKFNWFSGGFIGLESTSLDPKENLIRRVTAPMFVGADQHNYRLTDPMARAMTTRLSAAQIEVPSAPAVPKAARQGPLARQYRHPAGTEKRPAEKTLTLGAYAR